MCLMDLMKTPHIPGLCLAFEMTDLGDVKPDETIDYSSIKPITLPIDKDYHTFIAYKAGDPDSGVALQIVELLEDHLVSSRRNIKFVAVPCIDYNRDKEHKLSTCRYPHICAKYIINDDICDGSCDKNHNLVTNQSREILVDLGFITEGNYDCILETYRQKCKEKLADMAKNGVTGPCCYHNYKGCLLGDFHCPFTHICKDWFLGKCLKRKCALSQDILKK